MDSTSAAKPTAKARPLSPHLQIYKPQITSTLSILHRITGVGLAFGLIVLVAWLAALAGGPDSYTSFVNCATSTVGQIVLFGLTVCFCYHLSCGIRHLLWDAGLFLEIKDVYKTGKFAIAATVILTALIWLKVYGVSL